MSRRFLVSIFLSDLASLGIALVISLWLVFGGLVPSATAVPPGESVVPFIGMIIVGAVLGSTVNRLSWLGALPRPSYGRAAGIAAFTVAFVAIGVVITRLYWSRSLFSLTIIIWFVFMIAHRVFRRQRPWNEAMVIITDEPQLADELREAPHADVRVVFAPGENPPSDPIPASVTIALDVRSVLSESMARFVSSASVAGSLVRPLANVYEVHTGRIAMIHLAEGWEISEPVARSTYTLSKRLLDVLLVVLSSPVWLVVAACVWLAVRIGSKGPAFYRQTRVGRGGRLFTLYKFRSMVVDAEEDGPRFTEISDPRITKVGRVLRTTRLDEIPQMWNVLRGDLSLVGPRPERPKFVEEFAQAIPFYRSRHLIRPGVTGWAQVNRGYGDGVDDAMEKLTYDLYYVKNSSFWLDLHILGESVWTVIARSGSR